MCAQACTRNFERYAIASGSVGSASSGRRAPGRGKPGRGIGGAGWPASPSAPSSLSAPPRRSPPTRRHAQPYVQIAEDLLGEAAALAARCAAAPVSALAPVTTAPAAAPPTGVAAAPPAAVRRVTLAAELVFAFDRGALADLRPASRGQLEALLDRLRGERLAVASVRLTGHTDRLNGSGDAAYNQRLSERRVAAVRDHLVARGIDAALISTAARGDREPVERCAVRGAVSPGLAECLLPNRRVDIVVEAVAGRWTAPAARRHACRRPCRGDENPTLPHVFRLAAWAGTA